VTTPPEDPRWVDGSLESGADDTAPDASTREAGQQRSAPADGSTEDPPLGATVEEGATTTFEPEEDPA
jgi:hypothetical protein